MLYGFIDCLKQSLQDHSMVTQMFGFSVYVNKTKEKKEKKGEEKGEQESGKEVLTDEQITQQKVTCMRSLGILLRLLLRSVALLSVS